MKKLSIIIPHYNSVRLLDKLIDSIPIDENIEVIVIDDNSTLDLKEFEKLKNKHKHTNVVFLKNNSLTNSAGKCRNIGLDYATGKWVLFADADDYFIEGFYEKIKKYFDSNYDVVLFSPTSVYIDTQELSNRHIKYEDLISNYLKNKTIKNEVKLRYQYSFPVSKLIKKSLITKHSIKFDEVIAMNDIMFSTKIGYSMQNFLATTETIYCITRSKGSLTTTMTKEINDSRINALLRYYKYINENVSNNQKKYLNMSSFNALIRTYKTKSGFREVFNTYKVFKKNKINLLDKRFLNPFFIIKKTMEKFKMNKTEKYYYKR